MSKNLSTVEDILQLDVTELNQIAEDKGKEFVQKHGIKINQVRNIFGAIVKMRNDYDNGKKGERYEKIRRELILLKPKLAYAAAKQQEMEPFKDTFNRLIDLVENSKDQEKAASSFFEFFEAVVAYHKFYEEKKKKSKN